MTVSSIKLLSNYCLNIKLFTFSVRQQYTISCIRPLHFGMQGCPHAGTPASPMRECPHAGTPASRNAGTRASPNANEIFLQDRRRAMTALTNHGVVIAVGN